MKKISTFLIVVLTHLFLPGLSSGDYFVVLTPGEVRSGPGMDYPIVDTAKGAEVYEIPASFASKRNLEWIPIEWREVPKGARVKGWFQITTNTEYKESGEVVQGWYLTGLESIRSVGPGEIVYFIMEDDPEKLRYGEMLAKLSEEKTIGGLLYRKARFKLKERVAKEVEIEPEVGRFYWFYVGGCQGETNRGTLVERLMQRKTCLGEPYELGLFKVSAGFETLYTKWIRASLGERVEKQDVAQRLYEIRKSGFPINVQADILDRRIWRGMTTRMAKLSWGEPSWVSRTKTSQTAKEQWVYDYGTTTYYLHFRDGVLDSYRRYEQGLRR